MTDQSARARDHLANERTFLAWVRTGVALLGIGLVIARLRFDLAYGNAGGVVGGTTYGVVFALGGLASVVFALLHYQSNKKAIESGSFSPLGAGAVLLAGVIVVAGLVLVANIIGLINVTW